ncbi:MAG: hypothetical protein FWC00_06365 [Firmicutes bacterium]|nr:hypothetical protein [Bacillota bacterium]
MAKVYNWPTCQPVLVREALKEHKSKNGNVVAVLKGFQVGPEDEALHEEYTREKMRKMKSFGFNCEVFDVRNYIGKEDQFFKDLKDFKTMMNGCGGQIYNFLTLFKLVGFEKLLWHFWEKQDRAYVGVSCGISALAQNIDGMHLDCDHTKEWNGQIIEDRTKGLGLTEDLLKQHMKCENQEFQKIAEEVAAYRKEKDLPTTLISDFTMYERDTVTDEECVWTAVKNLKKDKWEGFRHSFDVKNDRFGNYTQTSLKTLDF